MEKSRTAPGHSFVAAVLTLLLAGLYIFYLEGAVRSNIAGHSLVRFQVMTATHALPQFDFARLWYVGRVSLLRRLAGFGWVFPVSPWFRATFQLDILSAAKHPSSVWLYPPTMTLLGTLFSFIPMRTSFWVWNIVTPVIAAIGLRKSGLSWLVIAAGLGSTAGIYNFTLGQNGALTGACLVAALICFDSKPKFGGLMAGLLCIKPQMGLVLPLILLRQQYFKAFQWCVATAILFILLSVLVEGGQSWVWFITVAEPKTALILNAPVGKVIPGAFTVLMMARSLDATTAQAWALQAASSAISAVLIWRRWLATTDDPIGRMAFTVCLSVLLTPYGYTYDLVGFSIAMAAMLERSAPLQKPVYALLWLMGGYYCVLWLWTGYNLMPVAAAIGAWTISSTQSRFKSADQSAPIQIRNYSA